MADRIDELTQQVANHLAGRSVIIRWVEPQAAHGAGQCYKTRASAGEVVIDISPYLTSADTKFRVYLHELAHARLDWDILPFLDSKVAPASVVSSPARRQAWRDSWRESRANQQAKAWADYADSQAWRYARVDRDWMTCRLLALLDWPGGE